MTTVCWDGKTLAADKLCTMGTMKVKTKKIFRMPDGALVGIAGDVYPCLEAVEWLRFGEDPETFPLDPKDQDTNLCMLVVRPNGLIHQFSENSQPLLIDQPYFAIGSGAHIAMTAMHLGKSAAEAIELACELDAATGGGIDTLSLEGQAEVAIDPLEWIKPSDN